MKRAIFSATAVVIILTACGNDTGPVVTEAAPVSDKDSSATGRTSEVQSPVEISYNIIGTPIVGQPVALDLQFKSSFGATPYTVTYAVNDQSALQLPDAQSASVSISPSTDNERVAQQVTVVPLREGRLYLNVAAVIETENGSMRTVTAVPIQVGAAAPREIIENGEVTTDEDGNLIRSLPAKEE